MLRLVRRNGKDHPWDCLERSCSSPADLLCTREGRRGSCAASVEEERRSALPTTDDVDLGGAGIRGALARGGRGGAARLAQGEDSSRMPMMPCRGSQGGVGSAAGGKWLGASASHGLCIVSVHWPEGMDAGGAVRQLREGAEEGGQEDGGDRISGESMGERGHAGEDRGHRCGSRQAVERPAEGGGSCCKLRAGEAEPQRVAERRRRCTSSRGFASAPICLSKVDARTDPQSDG